jgi:hypothetical protein
MAVEIAHGRLQEQEPLVSLLKHEQVPLYSRQGYT